MEDELRDSLNDVRSRIKGYNIIEINYNVVKLSITTLEEKILNIEYAPTQGYLLTSKEESFDSLHNLLLEYCDAYKNAFFNDLNAKLINFQ